MTAPASSFGHKERLCWAAGLLVVTGLLAAVLLNPQRHLASDHASGHAPGHALGYAPGHASGDVAHEHGGGARVSPGRPGVAQTAQPCRQGAFLEADRILGSLLTLQQTLPNTLPDTARSELDFLLYTALQQARSEVYCVAGVLTHGYDKAFAETVKKATALARQRGLSGDVAAIGDEVVRVLERNQLMAGPGEVPAGGLVGGPVKK